MMLLPPTNSFALTDVNLEQTGTVVLEVPGSIISWGALSCGLEQVTFPQMLSYGQKLIDSVHRNSFVQ